MSHEIKRRKVVLASVLKPVDDTRMLEKIASTLQASDEFEISIIGYPANNTVSAPGITLLPLPGFRRTSLKRLIIPWIIFRKINQVNPEIILINTPELLFVSVLNKIIFKRKIVYDVLENYYRNIRHTKTYPWIVRPLLAFFTRLTEIIVAPFVDHFLLAEKGYARELAFAHPGTIAENKLPKAIANRYIRKDSVYTNLLFTGTLAATTGIFEVITLAKELQKLNPAYTLTIIGYCGVAKTLSEIRKQIKDFPFITLHGGEILVPHTEILEAIRLAGTGIIIYPDNPGTESSIPTKLYEYLAIRLPILISHTEPSEKLVQQYDAGIVLQNPVNYRALNSQLAGSNFSFQLSDSIYWEEDGQKIIRALNLLK